jgi:peptide/nickel transport system substrate-binding protein
MSDGRFDTLRHGATAIENAVVDELAAGRIGRRDFLRHASVIGFTAPLLGLLGGCDRPSGPPARPGAVIRIGSQVPAGQINPITVADGGGLCMLAQTGEFLCVSEPDLRLTPALATGWSPNIDGSIWTFKIRKGVTFHDGRAMTARDVVASIDRLADPANGSTALSVFSGVLSKGGTKYIDDETIAFHLDAPHGSFPYLVSSDNYNCIILPADYAGDFQKNFIGTGPFRLEAYIPRSRASFVRYDGYWGPKALPDRVVFIFYDNVQAQILALQGGQLDALLHVPINDSQALLSDPHLDVVALKSSGHVQLHMRNDMGPFRDKRVRRAMALCLDRPAIITGMFEGKAALGNDSPFAPMYGATDPNVPQRSKDIRQARELLAAAGYPNGFDMPLVTARYQELPDYVVVVQNAVRQIGVNLALNVEDMSAYFGRATFGESDWLDSVFGAEEYAHRGTPNTFLSATLGSKGAFNAARFRNADYDRLVAGYIAALEPAAQRSSAGQLQRLLLDETPIITTYFSDWLSVTSNKITGLRPTAMSQLWLDRAGPKPTATT